jgi:hypothetical protein
MSDKLSAFRGQVLYAVTVSLQRVRECPCCGTLFVKVSKQKYCSMACAKKHGWQQYKARRPPRDHKAEYQVRKLKGV